jgi:hypothetical protein
MNLSRARLIMPEYKVTEFPILLLKVAFEKGFQIPQKILFGIINPEQPGCAFGFAIRKLLDADL